MENHNKITAGFTLKDEVEAALRYYCKFHLTKDDLNQVPELSKYIEGTFNGNSTRQTKSTTR